MGQVHLGFESILFWCAVQTISFTFLSLEFANEKYLRNIFIKKINLIKTFRKNCSCSYLQNFMNIHCGKTC